MMRTTHIFLAVAVFSSMVFANAEDVQDYSEYYKNYYETHSAQERQPAFPRQDLFTALATPETNVCIFTAIQILLVSKWFCNIIHDRNVIIFTKLLITT